MALQTSGAISFNDIHIEAGGTSGTTCALTDTDIRALIGKGLPPSTSYSVSEWYGASSAYFSATITIGTYTSPGSQYVASTFTTGYHNTAYGNPATSFGSITTDNAGNFQAGAKIAFITNNQTFFNLSFALDDNADVPNSGWTTLQIGSQSFSRTAASYSAIANSTAIGASNSQGRRSTWSWSYATTPTNHVIPNSGTISVLVT